MPNLIPAPGSPSHPARITNHNASAWGVIISACKRPMLPNSKRNGIAIHRQGCYVCGGQIIPRGVKGWTPTPYHRARIGEIHELCIERLKAEIGRIRGL